MTANTEKKEFKIYLNKIEDLKNFLHEITYHIVSDVDATYERQVIDAKSLIGLMSLSSHPINVVIHSDDLSEIEYFRSVCERFDVE